MPSEVIRIHKVLPKTLLPTVLRRLFFFVFWIYGKEKGGLGLSLTDGRKRTDVQKDVSLATGKTSKKICTIFFNLQKAFMPPTNKEFPEVLSNHFNKSFILKIHTLSDSGVMSTFWLQTTLADVIILLDFLSFPLNCSLQFAAPQD